MGAKDTFERIAASVDRAANALGSLNDQVDRAAGTEFTTVTAPGSFLPVPQPAPGTPGNPITGLGPLPAPPGTIFDQFGQPITRRRSADEPGRSTMSSSDGSNRGSGSQFKLADNPLMESMTPGAPLMRKSDLAGFVASGVCHIMDLPRGGHAISCPWGLYRGMGDNVLESMSMGRSGGETNPGLPPSERSQGYRDYNRFIRPGDDRRTVHHGASASSSTKPITDRLDRTNAQLERIGRALEGDGGASIRLKGGL